MTLAVDGPFPQNRDAFLQLARALYDTALSDEAYQAVFEANGITPERLNSAQAQLDTLQTAIMEHEIARADALRATTERDRAIVALRDWRTRFRRRARFILRTRRDLRVKLDL